MSLESDRKKSHTEKNEKPKIQIDTKSLLNQLAQKIASEYGIDVSQVKEFINSKTGKELNELKSLVHNETGKDINIEELKWVISGAKEVIEKASKEKIEVLKSSLDTGELQPRENFYLTQKMFSQETLNRIKNPQNLWDNITWAAIGIINSGEATIQLLFNIGTGVIQSPYHIYLLVSGQAEYKNSKRI